MSNDADSTPIERSRTVTWEDPLVGVAPAKTMSGLGYIQGLIDGSVPEPPTVNLMNMRPASAEVGKVTFTCDPDESHYNPIGTVHGGRVCTLVDSVLDCVLGCAVQTTLPTGQGCTSLEIKISYLRQVMADTSRLTAVGMSRSRGAGPASPTAPCTTRTASSSPPRAARSWSSRSERAGVLRLAE